MSTPETTMHPGDVIKLDTPVTTIIRQRPLSDAVGRYEDWLKEIIPVAQQFAGHQAVNVKRPHAASNAYAIVLHFDSVANLRKWLDSQTRMRLVEKIRPFLQVEENIDIRTGFEFWFTPPPDGKPAKPCKQFLVTLSAIFPLTIVVPWLLQPVFGWVPVLALPVIRQFIIAAAIVAIVVYAVMPRYTRLVSRWLFSLIKER
jgi:antibiotic biosynthesis monooxygenase (ABM) superfamily enzyme